MIAYVERSPFFAALALFPEDQEHIRFSAIKLSFCRALVFEAKARDRNLRAAKSGGGGASADGFNKDDSPIKRAASRVNKSFLPDSMLRRGSSMAIDMGAGGAERRPSLERSATASALGGVGEDGVPDVSAALAAERGAWRQAEKAPVDLDTIMESLARLEGVVMGLAGGAAGGGGT